MNAAAYVALKPAECWDWLSPRDLNRLTIEAFKLAKGNCHPPRGERWLDGGVPWSSPADFAETLARLLVLHLGTQAHKAGIPGHEYAPTQLAVWYGHHDAGDNNAQAGRSPVAMGQGWPASAAGGPGCESSQGANAPNTPTAVISSSENAS